ncbi:MAG TPA: long-chain fatty acid--CoA ligase [Kouleothrix sp.]|uniref:long-chain fatty acid--CoA ligase n=1 Tax=Kouleothrix sp. TaxID=2779161 RepID=UPI002D04C005|nr:long-chain fatty acid--CoA ligase [Kouleothrix sp.]HRC74835.1 long-chain fatty acid--CoA ligase [Kouleothrix sp.]
MQGLMMDYPLTLTHILERSRRLFPGNQIVTKTAGGLRRQSYAQLYERVGRLANAFERLGIGGDGRVATFAWNTARHLELYFAAPCSGRVLHTLNIRLFPEQVAYIANHAEDQVVFVDASLLPALEKLAPQFGTVKHYVVMADGPLPATSLPNVIDYEELLARESPEYAWPTLDENRACAMCYTSGTTGNPKGAVYSHRSMFLHSMMACLADTVAISERDTVLPVVPMFHANAWGMPYAATLVGAKQVMPGPFLDGKSLAELIAGERVTVAAGVPTIWMGLLQVLEKESYDISSLRCMPVGGSAAPQSMIERYHQQFGAPILHAWGMTELSPIGSVSQLKQHMREWPLDRQFAVRARQGTTVPGVEARVVDVDGRELPWDGQSFGELQVRGPWVIRSYYNDERSADSFQDGWFRTGDVATIDAEGYIQIVDRTKDLVKSGGEWISTVDLENAIMAHPQVLEAAVIAVPHPRWQERPLACVVPKPDAQGTLSPGEILEFLSARVARWQLPDEVIFIEAVPKTSVGKFDKKVLRERFKDYVLPDA